MIVAGIQHDIVWEDPQANFARLAPLLDQAAGAGARLALLSEMFSTGFSMDTERVGEPPDGPRATFLMEQAGRHGMGVGASIPERHDPTAMPWNQFVLAAPDGTTHR